MSRAPTSAATIYSPPQSVDSTGNIGVTCDTSTTYSISLGPGSGSYASRAMVNGLHQLH